MFMRTSDKKALAPCRFRIIVLFVFRMSSLGRFPNRPKQTLYWYCNRRALWRFLKWQRHCFRVIENSKDIPLRAVLEIKHHHYQAFADIHIFLDHTAFRCGIVQMDHRARWSCQSFYGNSLRYKGWRCPVFQKQVLVPISPLGRFDFRQPAKAWQPPDSSNMQVSKTGTIFKTNWKQAR